MVRRARPTAEGMSADSGKGCLQIEQAAVGLAAQLLQEQFGIVAEEVQEEEEAAAAAGGAEDGDS